jgi:HK97 family phage major capsid protein
MNLNEITEAMSACQKDMAELSAKAKTADAEKAADYLAAFRAKSTQFDDLRADYDRERKVADTLAEVEGARKAAAKSAERNINPEPPQVADDDVPAVRDVTPRAKALAWHGEAFNRFVSCKSLSDQDQNLLNFRGGDGVSTATLPPQYEQLIFSRAKTMLSTDNNTPVDSALARTIDPNFVPDYLRYGVFVPSIYDLTRPLPVGNGRVLMPMANQAAAGDQAGITIQQNRAEGAQITDSDFTSTVYEVSTRCASALTYVSEEALRRSAINIESILFDFYQEAMRQEFNRYILFEAVTGLLNNANIVAINRQGANAVDHTDLVNLIYAVRMGQRMRGMFTLADNVESHLFGQVDNEGRPLFSETTAVGMRPTLVGKPVVAHEYQNAVPATLASLGTLGDVIFGTWQDYGFGVEQGVTIERSRDFRFDRNVMAYRCVAYIGGAPIHPTSFSVLNP